MARYQVRNGLSCRVRKRDDQHNSPCVAAAAAAVLKSKVRIDINKSGFYDAPILDVN